MGLNLSEIRHKGHLLEWADGQMETRFPPNVFCTMTFFSQRAGIILPKLIVESNPYSLQWCDKIKQLKTTKQSPEGWHSLLAGREPAKFPSAHRDNLHLESDKVRGRDTAYVKTKGRDRPECMFAHVSIKYLQKETKRPIQERTHLGQAF